MNLEKIPTIPEYFKGKNIFLTGGSGFIGKVLMEKLLRSCPGVGDIYILLRSRKGKNPQERLDEIFKLPLFDILKKKRPDALKKIKIVEGDVMELGLGLSEADRNFLIENISIVYHAAACVRFDDPLHNAIILNVRGAREVAKLAKQMKNLLLLMHVSTTYCNTDKQDVIYEKIYPARTSWEKAIEIAEKTDPHELEILTDKYISPFPNTYTFTKSLAEHVVKDICKDMPVVILRPSVVVATLDDPFPGWMDNFYGPVGLIVGVAKGVLRSIYTIPDITIDYVPVDLVTKIMIAATWKKGITSDPEEKNKIVVYHTSNNDINPVSVLDILNTSDCTFREMPFDHVAWYPSCTLTTSWTIHYIKVVFYQLLPALFFDGILKILGHKPILFKVNRKIYIANIALDYFMRHQWKFDNTNILELEKELCEEDLKDFKFIRTADVNHFMVNAAKGAKQFLLNEHGKVDDARRSLFRMWVLAKLFNGFFYAAVIWLVIKLNIFEVITEKFYKYQEQIKNM